MWTWRLYVIFIIYIDCCSATLSQQHIPNKGIPELSEIQDFSGGLRDVDDISDNVENFHFNKLRGRLKPGPASRWNNQSIPRTYISSLHRLLFYNGLDATSTTSSYSIRRNSSTRRSSSQGLPKNKHIPRSEPNAGSKHNAAYDFNSHRIVYPRLVHSRTKRSLDSTWHQNGHHNHIMVGLAINGEDILVDLQLNRDLLASKYYERQVFANGSHILHRPSPQDSDMCHYQGFIKDRPGSWAAISTCDGIRGIVFDGLETHYVEPIETARSSKAPHYLLSQRDLIDKNYSCGYKGSSNSIRDLFHDDEFARLLRTKRSSEPEVIRGPFNSNSLSRYVELFLVMDKAEFEKHNSDEKKIYRRCKTIANIVNALYQPLNIFIALTGVEIWKEKDQVEVSTDGDKTLTNFLQYRKLRLIPNFPNDNAQLLTGKLFDSGVVGKALKGPICTYQYSGGVNMDHSESVGLVATTVAHEMGHNFGMEHDTDDCKCPDKRCIMAPSSGTRSPSHWSSCSQEYLAISFERSMDYCLRNRPVSLFDSPVCGNGFVEPGEQCDCGLPQHCDNPCCNGSTCMLYSNATCATGHCCDLTTCRPKLAGVQCRTADQECDLPEFCSGDSEYCPTDVFKENSMVCKAGREKAYCYEGRCRTHEHQCRLLWGPTGKNSHDRCYKLNLEGNTNGNCGYDWAHDSYKKCNSGDIKCGMMHCKHFNERLEFGMESVSKVSHRFIADKTQGIIPCRVAQVDLGLDMVDPGLAPDGAKCGYNRMCVNQKCMAVASLKLHVCDCNGRGVCNNQGHCHCDIGFAWPDCMHPGLGGSEDSGPASNPHATSRFVAIMFIFFLGIVPCGVIVALLYYSRGNIKVWLLKNGKSPPRLPVSVRNLNGNIRPKTSSATAIAANNGGPKAVPTENGTQPSPSSKANSPLLNGYANGDANAQFQVAFFGKHEGFTLSPIKEKVGCVGTHSEAKTGVQKRVQMLNHRGNGGTTPKVEIGQPSLRVSTNPAVEGPTTTILRPAPGPPRIPPVAVVSPSRRAPVRPLSVPDATTLVVRHGSMPKSTTADIAKDQKLSAVARFASFLGKKDSSTATTSSTKPESREAAPSNVAGAAAAAVAFECNTLPRKAAKINRENLMHLEISHPTQLQATELPVNLMPVRVAPHPPPGGQRCWVKGDPSQPVVDEQQPLSPSAKVSFAADVKRGEESSTSGSAASFMRFGSVRAHAVTVRPSIPKFGSMRAPRPKSLPPTRPSQPPPRPPLPDIPAGPECGYYGDGDDGDLRLATAAPIAYSDDFSCESPQESIYATIDDESPVAEVPAVPIPSEDRKGKKSLFSRFYSKPKKKSDDVQCQPKEPLYCNIEVDVQLSEQDATEVAAADHGELSSSDNDGGLLSEIVTELANREPKYVNTLSSPLEEQHEATERVEYANTTDQSERIAPPTNAVGATTTKVNWKTPKLPRGSPPTDNPSSSSSAKPRGVLSYLNKAKSQEAPPTSLNKSSIQSAGDHSKPVVKSSTTETKSFPRSTSTTVTKPVLSPGTAKPAASSYLSKPVKPESPVGVKPFATPVDKNHPKTNPPKQPIKFSRPPTKSQSSTPFSAAARDKTADQPKKPSSTSMPKISAKPIEQGGQQFGRKLSDTKLARPAVGPSSPRAKSAVGVKSSPSVGAGKEKVNEAAGKPAQKKVVPLVKPAAGPLSNAKGSPHKGSLKKGGEASKAGSASRSGVLAAAAKTGPLGTSNVAALQQKFESQNK